MKTNLKKELPLIAIVLLPFIYLAFIWNDLPEKVPMHWNFQGEIDGWGSKGQLIIIPILLPLLMYVVMLVTPIIDPKKRIAQMGGKFYQLKFMLVLLMSALALLILYLARTQGVFNTQIMYTLMGLLFIVLGNYFQSVKPNYFIGIRTPWTLENETVWKKTHKLGGWLFLAGGICIIILSLLVQNNASLVTTLFLIIAGIISIIPVLYSYLTFKKLEKTVHNG